jgi:TRAP-type C4-dicarboxylate transport system permease small subunit
VNRLRAALDWILARTISVLMAAMVFNVLWQVFTRFVLERPSSFTEELARFLMIWVGMLGAAYAVGRKSHLALDLLTGHLTGARRRTSEFIIHTLILLFGAGVMAGGGGRLVWIQLALGQKSAALQLKLGYVYLALPIAGACIVVYSLAALRDAARHEVTAGVQSSGLN